MAAETNHIQLTDMDDELPSHISDEDAERIRNIGEMMEGTNLINQRPRASGGGAETSAEATVELHFHFGDQNTTNIDVQGDSAIEKLKGFLGMGRNDEGNSDD